MSAPVRPRSGVALGRIVFVMLAAVALVTCTEEPTSPTRPGVGTLRVGPQFDAFARLVPLTLDNVRVIVVRPPSDTILTAARTFSPSNQQLTLSLPVLLLSSSEALEVTLELYAGTTLLFTGTTTVQVTAGVGSPPPASVPVSYQGPGATLAAITLAPRDTTVSLGASFPFGATAVDGQQNNVPQFYVSWSADNGTIDAAGVFTAPAVRDTLYVHATSPNGVADSTRVFVTAPPSTLTKTGGDAQSGIIGTRLPQPLAVRVNGSDGQPVAGASVAFTVTSGGGSVDSALATSDAQGVARSGATLGLTVGQQSFSATVSGIPAAVFTATATGVAPSAVTLAAGGNHTCEIRGGQTLCWGDNSGGQLGDGTTTDRAVPGPISGGFTFTSLAAGEGHTCALTAAGQAFCWGENFGGSLGDGTTNGSPTPVAVSGGHTFVSLTAGEEFTCGLTSAGQAFCWGYNFDGQLGDGTNTDRLIPTAVTGGLSFTGLDAGTDHTCGVTATGQAFCWGSNFDGQIGDGTQTDRNVPTAVSGGLSFSAIQAGFGFSCGLATSGSGFCWGNNFGFQLTSPQPVAGGFSYTAIAGGGNHICGLTSGGWRCGGDNGSGQLGDGTTTDRPSPVIPSGGFTFTALTGGNQHTCGRTSTATLCWGLNVSGQLGDGTTTDRLTPTMSVGPAATAAASAGNGQSATAGTAVPVAPAIVVRDGFNNPVRGLTVIFAVTGGGGSLTGAVTQTDAAGIATVGSWTLGATPGANALSATVQVGGVSGNPVSFTATGAAPSALTWDGSASNVWTDPNNWTPAVVPTSALDVIIPSGTPNQPALTTTGNTQSLTIQSGATLTLNGTFTLNVFGDFDNSGLITLAGGVPTLDLRGTTRLMRGNAPVNTSISGSYTLNGAVTVAGTLSISGGTGSLTVGGQLLSVSTLTVGSGGSLFMTNPADVVSVSGNLTMGGSDHSGKLTAGQLNVVGNFLQSSSGSPNSFAASGTHSTRLSGAVSTLTFQSPGTSASRFNHLTVQNGATGSLGSRVVVAGDLLDAGALTFGGRTLEVLGAFTTTALGTVAMTNALDSLIVGGDATFIGANLNGLLTAGTFILSGDMTTGGSSGSLGAFQPSGTHLTKLVGSAPQTMMAQSPATIVAFGYLDISAAAGGIALDPSVDLFGTFETMTALSGGSPIVITGNNAQFVNPSGVAVDGLVVDGPHLLIGNPGRGIAQFDNVTFQNQSPTLPQLSVSHPGQPASYVFNNLTFTVMPTGAGLYLDAITEGAASPGLTLDLVNPTPAASGGFVRVQNGAVINWPATAPMKTWTGAISTDWSDPGNWSPAGVPIATDPVTIGPAPNQPTLTASAVASGIVISGSGASLTIGGQTLTLTGNLTVHTDGLLIMTNPADVVIVGGDAAFQGGDETGLLSAGELRLAGSFNQTQQTTSSSFVASGTHRTVMTGATLQSVTFCCSVPVSGFQDLDLSNSAGINIQFAGNGVRVFGTLISQAGAGPAPLLYTLGSTLTTARVLVDKLIVDRGTLVIDEAGVPAAQQLDNVTFQNYLTTFTQLRLIAPGGAAGPRTLTFNNLLFQPLTTGNTGRYLNVTAPTGTLIVDLPGASPAGGNGPAFTTTSGAVTVNWPAAAGVTWTGTVSTAWTTAGNWSGGVVPTASDDVTIPSGTPFSPAISGAPGNVRDLTVMPGAVLTMGPAILNVAGSLDAQGSIAGATTALRLTGAGTVRGNLTGTFFSLDVNGTYTLSGRLVSPGITINGSLTLAGFTAVVGSSVGDDFSTVNNGVLVMTNPTDSLIVGGAGPSVTFTGGSTAGELTAGVILMNSTGVGAFTQDNTFSDFSFAPSGTHKVVLMNASATLMSMDTPGAGSHFNILDISAQTGGITLQTTVQVNGLLISTPVSTAPAVNGGSNRLNAGGGTQITGLTLTNAPMVISGGSSFQLDNVTFQSMPASASQLSMALPGSATPLTFSNLVFSAPPTTGFYVDVADSDGPSPDALTVNLVNPTPATPGPFAKATNGAVINWPASGPVKTWTGGTQDWHTTSNWSPAGVPTATDDVVIGSAPNQPILSANATARNVTIQSGFLLNLNSFALAVTGDVSAPTSTSFIGGGGVLQLNGAGKTIAGTLSTALSVTVNGTYMLAGRTTIGALTVTGTGDVSMNGHTLVVGGGLTTTGSGTITMTNALDSALVTGAGIFGGGDESGKLTDGYLKIGGSFTQTSATSASSFAASGTHKTELGAPGSISVTFATPASSRFQELDLRGATALVLGSDVTAAGTLIAGFSAGAPTVISGSGFTLTTGGANVAAISGVAIQFDGVALVLLGGAISNFNDVAFDNQNPNGTAFTVNNVGATTPFTFNRVMFSTALSAGGFHLVANDLDGATPDPLTINMASATPSDGTGTFSATNGAVINWPPPGGLFTWNGAVNTDWSTPGNWDRNAVPGPLDDVTIPFGTPDPVLSGNVTINDILVNGGRVTLGTHMLVVGGDLNVGGSIDGLPGSGVTLTCATGQQVGGVINTATVVTGNCVLATFLTVQDLSIQGSVDVVDRVLGVTGNLTTLGSGILITNGGGQANVSGNATFDGGNELGQMSAGSLIVGGNLTQLASSSGDSFHPSGTHTTILVGVNPSISFATPGDVPGSSHFQEVFWTPTGGTMTLLTDVFAHGIFGGAGSVDGTIASSNGRTLRVGGFFSQSTIFDNVQLVLHQASATIIDLQNVAFVNTDPAAVALTTEHNGVPSAQPLSYSNISFSTVPTTGLYLRATDLASDGNPLIVDMVNPSPADPAGFVEVLGGATINWPAGGPVIVWNGSVDTDWFNTANWNGGVVPTGSDNVLIPSGAPNYPDASNIDMNDLTIQAGASLTTSDHTITVNGDLDASGSLIGCCDIQMMGDGSTARGNLDGYNFNVDSDVTITLSGVLSVSSGSVSIQGELIVNGQTLLAPSLTTFDGGLLTMTNAADFVSLTSAQFNGGDETGRLTAGLLIVQSFSQGVGISGDQTSFFASGNHFTALQGSGTVGFQSPLSSRFQHLSLSGGGSVVLLSSDVTAAGTLGGSAGSVTVQTSVPGSKLTAGGGFATGGTVTFDNVPLILSGGALVGMDNVTFTNMDPAVTQLTVNNIGGPTPFSFDNLDFQTTPTSGLYLSITDLDGPSPDAFTVNVISGNPFSGTPFTQANNGAVLNWPGVAPGTITWSGSAGTDWFDSGNWVGGVVPGAFDNVFIGVTANQPVLTNNAGVSDLSMQTGSTLEIADFVLVLGGDVDAAGTIDDVTGTGNGGVTVTGTGILLQGFMNTTVAVVGNPTMNGNLTTGDLSLSGSLTVGANFLGVQGVLATTGGGTLVMNHVSGQVQVSGDAVFNGGSTAGLLTAGTLTIGGDFLQVGSNSAQSFAADPGHLTVMSANPANITFTTPGTNGSHFGDFAESGFGATFNLNSDVTILGYLSGGDGFGGTMVGSSCPTVLTLNAYFTSGPLTLDCVRLVIDDPGGSNTFLNGISFSNLPTDVVQLTIQHPGVSGGNLQFNSMTFVPLTGGDAGLYVSAVETTPGAPALVVDFSSGGANVGNGPSFTSASGGASVLWP